MTKTITEAAVLRRVKDECKRLRLGFLRMTLRQGSAVGWPDVIVIGPNAGILFMELKRPGKNLRPIQVERARLIQSFGHHYAKVDTPDQATQTLLHFGAMCHRVA